MLEKNQKMSAIELAEIALKTTRELSSNTSESEIIYYESVVIKLRHSTMDVNHTELGPAISCWFTGDDRDWVFDLIKPIAMEACLTELKRLFILEELADV
jgi:hypothetical protein